MGEPALAAVTAGQAVADAARRLVGSQSPRLDAELLLGAVLDVGRERLVIDRDSVLPEAAQRRFWALVERRAAHEPVAYLLGRRGFRQLELAVDRRVLIPRPETELLVEVAAELVGFGGSVIDVGTGSGAVALALKDERPDLDVRGVDVSGDAITVAVANAHRLGLDVAFAVGDLLSGMTASGPRAVDAVVANLPYVELGAALAPDIARYEPPEALFAGVDGLDVIRRLIDSLPALAAAPSLVALEIGPAQAAIVAALLSDAGLTSVQVRQDLAGRDRVVVACP